MYSQKTFCLAFIVFVSTTMLARAGSPHPRLAPNVTTLTNPGIEYTVELDHHAVLQRADIEAIIVDNASVNTAALPGHEAGYNGVASLTHTQRPQNLFVPSFSGLNFEFLHDGTRTIELEIHAPRKAPSELRVIDDFTVEVYQPTTPLWNLESSSRYHLLPDGTIEFTFEARPREDLFRNDFMGMFWASYITNPEDKAINFKGRTAGTNEPPRWIRTDPRRRSTHTPDGPLPDLQFDPGFPLRLVNDTSDLVHTEPWFYGVADGMAYVQMFRRRDSIWFAQFPSGGGGPNPAWDFEWFVPHPEVGEAYGFVMRAAYVPFESHEQIEEFVNIHLQQLAVPEPSSSILFFLGLLGLGFYGYRQSKRWPLWHIPGPE